MGGGGKGGQGQSGAVDYPEYMKTFHGLMLNASGADAPSMSIVDAFNIAVAGPSPYYNYITDADPIGNLFGATSVMVNGKVFDLLKIFQDTNFDTTLEGYNQTGSPTELIAAVSLALDDEININVLPRFKANLRGIGAVQSSAYAIGEALIWDSKVKAIAKERLTIETVAIQGRDQALRTTVAFLEFKKLCAFAAVDVAKNFYSIKYDIDDHFMGVNEKDLKWDLDMFQYLQVGLSSIGGTSVSSMPKGPSKIASAVGGALSGAAMGAMVAGPWGAVAGGALGLAGGLLA